MKTKQKQKKEDFSTKARLWLYTRTLKITLQNTSSHSHVNQAIGCIPIFNIGGPIHVEACFKNRCSNDF